MNDNPDAVALIYSWFRKHSHSLSLQCSHKLTGRLQFLDNVQSANEFALYVDLRISWPIGVGLQALPHLLVIQNVECFIW